MKHKGKFHHGGYLPSHERKRSLVAQPYGTRLYTLATPWYGDIIVNFADNVVLEHRRKTTPAPFARRNVFCGNRLYQNKYELNEWLQEARSKGMNDPRDIWRSARQKKRLCMAHDLPHLVIASSIGGEAIHFMDHAPTCALEVEARTKSAKQEIAHLLRRRTHTVAHPDTQGN